LEVEWWRAAGAVIATGVGEVNSLDDDRGLEGEDEGEDEEDGDGVEDDDEEA
jgi:hypothetical protein